MSPAERLLVTPDFFDEAAALRAALLEHFGSPRVSKKGRFIWDYFHVPAQYTYVRTLPEYVFPPDLYSRFLRRIRAWGVRNLGCAKIISPWLSFFVEGCRQELHTDVPHGPWAFVYSLTDWEPREFTGGETMLLTPECLDYWRGFNPVQARESASFVELVPPRFNQLTVFDPRIPHGVCPVHGTLNPLASRIVLHGWFRQPTTPILSEGLEGLLPASVLEAAQAAVFERLSEFPAVTGLVTARMDLSPPRTITILSNTLLSTVGPRDRPLAAVAALQDVLGTLKFPPAPEGAWVILPFPFPAPAPS